MTGTPATPPWWRRPWILPALGVLGFFLIRLTAAMCVGDSITSMGDQEAKHTELAWALRHGMFGTENWQLSDFLLTGGNIHHPGYLTISLWFAVLAKFVGQSLLALRLIPILWWTGAIAALCWIVHRRIGPLAAAVLPLAFWFAPVHDIGFQLHTNGSHTEALLPLALLLASFSAFVDAEERSLGLALVSGFFTGYAFAFSYLLWPPILMLLALGAFRPRFWSEPRRLGQALAGFAVGSFPLWFLSILQPGYLWRRSLTEDTSSVFTSVAAGGKTFEQFRFAFVRALRLEWQDGGLFAPAGRELMADGGIYLYRSVAILGGLLLLPAVLRTQGATRRLGIALAILPFAMLVFLSRTTPFEFIKEVYVMSPLGVGLAWPALALGLGWTLWRAGGVDRAIGGATAVAGVLALGFFVLGMAPLMAPIWQPDRADALLRHRYSAYWHYRAEPVPAEQVDLWNDFIDVREQEGDPMGAFGLRMTLYTQDDGEEIREDAWMLESWEEVRGNFERAFPDTFAQVDMTRTAHNIGWGLGIRTGWDVAPIARMVGYAERTGRLPSELEVSAIWEGWGFGRARAELVGATYGLAIPASDSALSVVPSEHQAAVARGMAAGRALGAVPKQGKEATLRSALAGPT